MINTNLEGRVAIVTGGSQGIGAATAFALGQAGASVALTYNHSKSRATEVVEKIGKIGSKESTSLFSMKNRLFTSTMSIVQ